MGLWNQKMQEDFKSDYEKFKDHIAELAATRQQAEWALNNAQSANSRIRSNEDKLKDVEKKIERRLEELEASVDYINYIFPKINAKIHTLELNADTSEKSALKKIEKLEAKQKKSSVAIIIFAVSLAVLGVLHAIR